MVDVGELVPLGQMLVNTTWFGYVTDIDSPTGVYSTMEQVGDEAFVTMAVLKGDKGDRGDNAPLIDVLWDISIVEVGDLPLAPGPSMINKGYWIGDLVYIWTGTTWIAKRPGPAGAKGDTPEFDWTVETLTWDDQLLGELPSITSGGDPENPQLHVKIPQGEPGPIGPAGFLRTSADYYEDVDGPEEFQVITWDNVEGKYTPMDPNYLTPRMFTVPEGAFTNFSGISTRQTICHFQVPAQPYDYMIWANGHINVTGVELDADPLTIGAEIRIDDPTTGQLVARAFGNSSMWAIIQPHVSSPTSTMEVMQPEGTTGRVNAGAPCDVYLNITNDGLLGVYLFNKLNSQMSLMLIPVT